MQRIICLAVGLLLSAVFVGAGALQAQQNEAVKVAEGPTVSSGEKTDLIFTRSFLLGSIDSVPFDNARSGVYSLGIGYGIPIGKVLEIKFEPTVTWHKVYFTQSESRWFPQQGSDSLRVYEKMRSFYLQIPVALKFKLARNEDDKYKVLIEAGFSIGYNTGSTFKVRDEIDTTGDGEVDSRQTIKTHNIPNLARWRYGPYFRLGTNWGSLYGFYRMTELFEPGASFTMGTVSRSYPSFPQLELGFSFTL